tara:strand:- start:53 stop:496 length:444 start_codon:yes stop_codon:yes gene_type:complete
MINSQYEKYLYFREVADEDQDDGAGNAVTIPVSSISAILPGDAPGLASDDNDRLAIFFDTYSKYPMSWATAPFNFMHQKGCILLQLKSSGKFKETMRDLVEIFNGNARDNYIVVADDAVTDVGAATGNKRSRYASPHIESVVSIKAN